MSENNHTPEPLFLMNGMRFKLSFHDICCNECGAENNRVTIEPLGMYANDLNGKWVALVPADNDRHLDLLRLEKQRDELLAAQQELLDALDHQISDPDRLFRAKNASRAAIARAKGGAA